MQYCGEDCTVAICDEQPDVYSASSCMARYLKIDSSRDVVNLSSVRASSNVLTIRDKISPSVQNVSPNRVILRSTT